MAPEATAPTAPVDHTVEDRLANMGLISARDRTDVGTGRRSRIVDLEEMMLMEAIRQSLEEEEVRKRKEEEEERKKRGKMNEVPEEAPDEAPEGAAPVEGKGKNVDRGSADEQEGKTVAGEFGFEGGGMAAEDKRTVEAEHVEVVRNSEGLRRS